MTRQHPWEREAENWLGWTRTPRSDAYSHSRGAFCDDFVVGGRTLEVGCGERREARGLARRGHEVTAIDPLAPLLEHARDADAKRLYARAD